MTFWPWSVNIWLIRYLQCMTIQEAVQKVADQKLVEKIVAKITSSGTAAHDPDSLQDLCQDIYMSLLTDDKFVNIVEEGHENFWVTRIVMNNIMSSSSRYYRNYLLPQKRNVSIMEQITKDLGTTEY